MKILVIDPIIKSRKLCSFSVYDEDGTFLFQHLVNSKDQAVEQYFDKDKYLYLCFDAFKIMDVFGSKFSFVYDVKILYELQGNKFNNLIDLGIAVLGRDRMNKYVETSDKVKAHLSSYRTAKIECEKFFDEDLFPQSLVEDLHRERASIVVELYRQFREEDIRKFYHKFYSVIENLHSIGNNYLDIDLDAIKHDSSHYADIIRSCQVDEKLHLKFNVVGAKTGRLGFRKGSVNLYNLPRTLRKCIVAPRGYKLLKIDYRSCQPRLAIFSTDDEKFKDRFKNIDDIYSVFPGDREKNKIFFLAWMYSNRRNELFEKEAFAICELRTKLYQEAKRNKKLINKFGRVLPYLGEEKNVVFQNYITSLEVDVILGVMVQINSLLENMKSRIITTFHDAIIYLIYKNELELIETIKDKMESFCQIYFETKFPVEVKIGNNFGEMNEIN